ncbi:MAG TPA: ATPase, T2SS/T4P/T4SS family, partial [Vicinamibacterales bacterium]|nr:ATPase, T2SS/T4P/T4SS family [Vicinamibacterales bacterium]
MTSGWDVIIPFLRPIAHLLRDPEITDILVNGSGSVFIEKAGRMSRVDGATIPEKFLQVAVRNIARLLDHEISEEQPILDARLPDGSRVAAVFPPCSVNGTTLAIRILQPRRFTLEELVRVGTLTATVANELATAVTRGESVVFSGAAGAGKTTLLSALTNAVPDDERIILIEDTAEIQMDRPNLVRLEARREQTTVPAVTIRDLLRATLRLRPDRIVVGELRGAEAFDWLQALNTGHRGTLATTHANSARGSLERLFTCVLMANTHQPQTTI